MRLHKLMIGFVLLLSQTVFAADYYVSTKGSDKFAGIKDKPFRTIQKAADVMAAGDTCYVRGGTYRETIQPKNSGEEGKPIRFIAAEGETVVLDGTEPVKGQWSFYKGKIYRTKVRRNIAQLFVDGEMMVEARWPNMRFDRQLWDRSCWAVSGKNSRYGKMVDAKLARTGIDWTGGIAVLNVAHQFRTWTRRIQEHSAGSNTFTYARNLQPITSYAEKTTQWEDDRYYLFGKLEALDAPGEWFLDTESRTLYLWTPDGDNPASHKVQVKVRDYAFDVNGRDYIEVAGFKFFGTTLRLENCNHCVVENCRLIFPAFMREFNDPSVKGRPAQTYISGDYNTVRRCLIAYSKGNGLVMAGTHNTVENNIIHDVVWTGQGCAIGMEAKDFVKKCGCVVKRNTAYNCGYGILHFGGQGGYLVQYNHFYNAALAAKDCAVIQTGLPLIEGSIVRYNWVHGCRTLDGRGHGIRGDDQTRGLIVHHNVVWNCGKNGIIVKGDRDKVLNNTVLDIGTEQNPQNYISLHVEPEPYKPWRYQWPLIKTQNANSIAFNNVARTVTLDRQVNPLPESKNVSYNFRGDAEPKLVNPEQFDFRPGANSPLIDAGRVIPGYTDGYKGNAPDIGAYEYSGENWKPGADWTEEQ